MVNPLGGDLSHPGRKQKPSDLYRDGADSQPRRQGGPLVNSGALVQQPIDWPNNSG
ncbi:MAG: hypothetical protein RL733_388, partial [Actinomycetota bacterium]